MFWQRYQPSDKFPWNLQRVAHLHRRAGFAASQSVLERDLQTGPTAAIDRLLAGRQHEETVPEDFEALAGTIGDAAVASGNIQRLKAWWLYRMIFSPDPLGERLALVWHNHFATSYRKVQNVALMREQNEVFRRHAAASSPIYLRRRSSIPRSSSGSMPTATVASIRTKTWPES